VELHPSFPTPEDFFLDDVWVENRDDLKQGVRGLREPLDGKPPAVVVVAELIEVLAGTGHNVGSYTILFIFKWSFPSFEFLGIVVGVSSM
jgi:hypothetical protein